MNTPANGSGTGAQTAPHVAGQPAKDKSIDLVDCDVHAGTNSIDDLIPYLPNVWQKYVRESGFKAPPASWYPKVKPFAAREDAHPPSGCVPGSDFEFLCSHHMDHWGIDRAVLNPLYGADVLPNRDLGAALCRAHNDYMIENWYEKDDRLYGSIILPVQDAEQSAREIERVGGHPKVVQIILFTCNGLLYGQRCCHPIWRAAEEQNLVVGIHWGGACQPRATGGAPSYYNRVPHEPGPSPDGAGREPGVRRRL